MRVMDSVEITSRPGRSAPLLIYDLLDYDPRHNVENGRNILADDPPQRIDDSSSAKRKSNLDCRHDLARKGSKVTAPADGEESPDTGMHHKVEAFCLKCRYHFEIEVDFTTRKSRLQPCILSDEQNPLHHLQLFKTTTAAEHKNIHGDDRYNTLHEAHKFVCTGDSCPAIVDIRIVPPRLDIDFLKPILSHSMVLQRGQKALKADADRLVGMQPIQVVEILNNLRIYLKDARSSDTKRNVMVRNKKFTLGFAGGECDEILRYLGFEYFNEAKEDGERADFWTLPVWTAKTESFLRDVLDELDVLISREVQNGNRVHTYRYAPVRVLNEIKNILGYLDYPTNSRTVDLSRGDNSHFASLGVLDNFSDELVIWAYDRQCKVNPDSTPYYFDCLADLATERNSLALQTKQVMVVSTGQHSARDLYKAYRVLGDTASEWTDDDLAGVFAAELQTSSLQRHTELREAMRMIARDRHSDVLATLAGEDSMTSEEALKFLNVDPATDADSVVAAAIATVADGQDKPKVAEALKAIGIARNDAQLQRQAASLIGDASPSMSVNEAFQKLQIQKHDIAPEIIYSYYEHLVKESPAFKSSYDEALGIIAESLDSTFLRAKMTDPDAEVRPASMTEPVGLYNIGNTCYLNSLLQFFYTVKPVRNIVNDIDSYLMPLTAADVDKKFVGRRQVESAAIVEAQKLLYELRNMFEELKTASTSSVKPTLELAELVLNGTKTSDKNSQAPGPLNSNDASSNLAEPKPNKDDIEMTDEPGDLEIDVGITDPPPAANVHSDNTDASSESTLLDDTLDPMPGLITSIEGDGPADKSLYAPKPPPVPPRNKSALSITTTQPKGTINGDKKSVGRQEDVTEAIKTVIDLLRCALKPTSIDNDFDGEQIDSIWDTFYGANAEYTQKGDVLDRNVAFWNDITINPDVDKTRDIYEALDDYYDEQMVALDKKWRAKYFSITKLPPLLSLCIQRSKFDKATGLVSKNMNAVSFPDTIYLDRYMDSDSDSSLMQRRRQAWILKKELRKLEQRQDILRAAPPMDQTLQQTAEFIKGSELLEITEIGDFSINEPWLHQAVEETGERVRNEMNSNSIRISELKKTLAEQFDDLKEQKYQLQTVFIHRGNSLQGGHYWTYTYDFQRDIWREYNDEYVTEIKDRKKIFEPQDGGATPYFLVYVRSADKDEWVDAVLRQAPEPEMEAELGPGADTEMEDVGNEEPKETELRSWAYQSSQHASGVDDDSVQHVECANVRPSEASGEAPTW